MEPSFREQLGVAVQLSALKNVSCYHKISYFIILNGLALVFNLYSGVLSAKVRALSASQSVSQSE